MIGFNRLDSLIGATVGLLSLGAFVGISLPAKAQTPTCYMITSTGELINLSSICGVEQTPTRLQNNAVTGQQANQTTQTTPYRQNVTSQQLPLQQQPITQQGNYLGQGTAAVPSSVGRPTQGTTVFYGGLGTVTDSAEVRSEPSGGSLVQQLQGGEAVRVYPETQTNNSVLVETSNGQRGWMNIWNLPGTAGASP